MKTILKILAIIFYIPALWLILFVVFLVRACIKLGHMPKYGGIDPTSLDMLNHYYLLISTAECFLWLVCIILPIALVLMLTRQITFKNKHLRVFHTTVIVFAVLFLFDPGGFIEWLFD